MSKTMTTSAQEQIDAHVQIIRDLRVLPDRAASGDLSSEAYAAEWRRLDAARKESAKLLTSEQLAEAYDRAKLAC